MRWGVLVALLVVGGVALAMGDDDQRMSRIEEDLSVIAKMLAPAEVPAPGGAVVTADMVRNEVDAVPVSTKPSLNAKEVSKSPIDLVKHAIVAAKAGARAPAVTGNFNTRPEKPFDPTMSISPLPGNTDVEFEKLPEPVINPNDAYEMAEDRDAEIYRSITTTPCHTGVLMPEADDMALGQDSDCVPGAHQVGKSRAPSEAMCPGSPLECSDNGVCVDGQCRCDPMHYGDDCGLMRCYPACSAHGQCNNGTCACDAGYTGALCDLIDCNPTCGPAGTCRGGVCECDPGHEGPTCESVMCPGTPQCSGVMHGVCDNSGGVCQCYDEWGGDDCSLVNFPCPNECQNLGKCMNGTCVCAPGWEGVDCSTKMERTMTCEGGAVWTDYVPRSLLTCENAHLSVEYETVSSSRCACPESSPVFDVNTRQCVEPSFCGTSACGLLPTPAHDGVVFQINPNADCSEGKGDHDGTCGGCVLGHQPVTVCFRMGSSLAQQVGLSREVVVALFRQEGNCEGVETESTFEELTNSSLGGDVGLVNTNDTAIDSGDGSTTITTVSSVRLPSLPSFKGIPHLKLSAEDRKSYGTVSVNLDCLGTYDAYLVLVDSNGETSSFGECTVDAEPANCPGSPLACSGHGSCTRNFNSSSCQCDAGFNGVDCSMRYVQLPTSNVTVLPGNISTSIPIPPSANISQYSDRTSVQTTDGSSYVFFFNGTVTIAKPDGTTQVINPSYAPVEHQCQGNSEWAECDPGCVPTCRNPAPRCQPSCTSGACQCPRATPIWDELAEQCVVFAECSEQSPCPGVGAVCSGKGECVEGICQCSPDWSGSDCSHYTNPGPRVTNGTGSVAEGTPCHLPFLFRGVEYDDCISAFDSDGQEWCSATYEWEQQWGLCAPRGLCPAEGGVQCNGRGACLDGVCVCQDLWSGPSCAVQKIRYTNVTMKACEFPFIGPDLHEYVDCIPGIPVLDSDEVLVGVSNPPNNNASFCLTSFRFEGTESLGFCAPRGSCGNCSETGGVCDGSGTGRCICKPGYSGVACDHVMSERDVLVKLFSDTNGYLWNRQFGWGSPTEPCDHPTWTGITCRNDKVIRVNLAHTGLTGTIPQELSALPFLQVLDLSHNHLTGTVPSSLVGVETLKSVVLADNFLTGKEPKWASSVLYVDQSDNLFAENIVFMNDPTGYDASLTIRVTDGNGSAPEFTECAFPFEYMGQNYTACTKKYSSSGEAWCSTTTTYKGDWGMCAPPGVCAGVGSECSGHGKCIQAGSVAGSAVKCDCDSGYMGRTCQYEAKRVTSGHYLGSMVEQRNVTCQLPFVYNGNTYDDCTSDFSDDGKEWCLTTGVWERRWGYCAPGLTCPGINSECSGNGDCVEGECQCHPGWGWNDCSARIPRVTDGTYQAKGTPCHFPFTLNGVVYDECTTAPSFTGEPYCAVRGGNLEDHQEWDFCAPVGVCPGEMQCSANGQCYDGECVCDDGYTGVDCNDFMTERDILIKLFRSTDGQSWIDKSSWEENHHCTWYGITCNDAGHTIGIHLPGNRLDGTLPVELGHLLTLQSLDVSQNFLAGEIPSTLTQLPNLFSINLSSNEFVGSLPALTCETIDCDDNCLDSPQCTRGLCSRQF